VPVVDVAGLRVNATAGRTIDGLAKEVEHRMSVSRHPRPLPGGLSPQR
jgi:hypothetical protein